MGGRRESPGAMGARPKQHIRLTGCPFRFVVQWNLSRGELQVKNGHFRHNHQVSAAVYATYPSSHGVDSTVVGAQVEGMLSSGAKRSKIYDYLLEHNQNVIQVDVDNLVRGHVSAVSGGDDNDATVREIAAFAASHSENVSTIAETDAGETGVISLASAHMRRIFSRFSEVLLVDCTHKTNRYNYQLLTFMAINEFGEGAVVQQSLIEANGDWHMERAIDHFKRLHPTRINMLRVIVVDKDLNEIRVLESNFPEARILICHFHVIKYLKEMRSKPEFGKISGDDASQVDAAIHEMVYARKEDDYNDAHESLCGLCDRIGLQDFFAYFERNWDTCQDRWVMYRRAHLPHFKNHTNNRQESFFGKLKDSVDSSKSMAECVKALVAFDRHVQKEYQYRLSRIGQFANSNYDDEMSTVLRFTTHFVASQVESQYARALEKNDSYRFTDDRDQAGVVVVGGKFSEHRLRLKNWKCDCEFAQSMKLPCRHAIVYRKAKNVGGTLIPWNCIDERWTSCSRELKKVKQFAYECFDSSSMGRRRNEMRYHQERYREAVRATHLIANEMADIEDEAEFSEMLTFVLNQWRNIRQKKRASSSPSMANAAPPVSRPVSREEKEIIKQEFGVSSSADEDMNSVVESEVDGEEGDISSSDSKPGAKPVKIRLNPKAMKVGRPQKQKKNTVAGEKQDRKWFKAADAGRKTAGEVTLKGLMDTLDREQPSLAETERRLSGILVKYSEADKKKLKFKRMKNPVLILDPFYILPQKLLDACMDAFPMANSEDTAIAIDASQGTPTAMETAPAKAVEVVQIKDIGTFSRQQIETFKKVQNLKACVQLGLDMHKWLTEEGIPSLPADYHDPGNKVAMEIVSTYPHKHIESLPDQSDLDYAMLYRAIPPIWLTDASIRALCMRLVNDYGVCRFAGLQSATTKTKRTRNSDESVLDDAIRNCVLVQVRETGVDTVLLPPNFQSAHWCCVVIKVGAKRIYYYDPLNQAPYMNAAKAVATNLKISGLDKYDVIPQNNPIQFDAYSCGVYVCWMFIRQVVPGPSLDMSANALTRRRFELFFYLLTGRLLPVEPTQAVRDDQTEEKMPAPSQDDESKEGDEVASSQVAA